MASNRVTEIRRPAASAAAGTPFLGKPCALATSTPDTLPAGELNCGPDVVRALPMDDAGGERSVDAERTPAAGCEAQRGKQRSTRDDRGHAGVTEAPAVAATTDDRPGDNSTGQVANGADVSVEPTWPEEPELFALVRLMLTGGDGKPAAPATDFEPSKATHQLLVRVQNVVKKLKTEHGGEMHKVPDTNGRIDQQEGRGYLLGAVLGRGLLAREQAKAAGFDARNKLAALEKRLASQKEAARKAARKLSGEALEKHEATAHDERQLIERERIALDLPPPPPMPPMPRSAAAGRKRAEPPPPDPFEDRFEKWCRRQGGTASQFRHLPRHMGEKAFERLEYAREWNPRSWKGRAQLAKLRERDSARNDLCTCDEGVPSFLCRVSACYSFEVVGDGGCDERSMPGCHSCLCMLPAWGDEERGVEPASPKPRRSTFGPPDPTDPAAGGRWDPVPEPAGGWPPVEPRWTFAKWKVAFFAGDIDRREQLRADDREDAAILERRHALASMGPPPDPPGKNMFELARLYREHPEAIAQIKGILARQDISEAQQMMQVRRLVRQARDAVPA